METATSPDGQTDSQGCRHVVTRPHRYRCVGHQAELGRRRPGQHPRLLPGPENIREGTGPIPFGVDEPQQVEPVAALGGRPVTGAGGVAPIRHAPPGEPEVQPIVRQHHPCRAGESVGLATKEPRKFGHGEGSHRHAPRGLHPTLGGQAVEQRLCVGSRLGVVPELGRAQHPFVPVEDDQAVLLCGHGQPLHVGRPGLVLRCFSQGGGHGLHQGGPPPTGRLLASRWGGGGVFGSPGADHPSGVHVTQLDFGRLGGGVDPGYERHRTDATGRRCPPTRATASPTRLSAPAPRYRASEPMNPAVPKLNTPPSAATSQ